METVVKTFTLGKYDTLRVGSTYGLDDGDYIVIQILSVDTNYDYETTVMALMAKKER